MGIAPLKTVGKTEERGNIRIFYNYLINYIYIHFTLEIEVLKFIENWIQKTNANCRLFVFHILGRYNNPSWKEKIYVKNYRNSWWTVLPYIV